MRRKILILTNWIIFMVTWMAVSACSAPSSASQPTASQLSVQGKTVYQQHCLNCHGADGQRINGSALLGQNNVLDHYPTGQALYDYISKLMPDDHPGSLSPTQYLQVESYLLLQNGYVKPEILIRQDGLDQITIKR
jgi:mono/diheme cytochrome c family protein